MPSVATSFMRIGNRVGSTLYRRSHGRIGGGVKGLPVLLLTVVGRKSGEPHTVPVAYFEHDDGLLVVGSAGGMKDEPQWFRNLRKAKVVTVQRADDVREMTPRVLRGEEYLSVWNDVVLSRAPFFGKYELKSGRTIPVAKLEEGGAR